MSGLSGEYPPPFLLPPLLHLKILSLSRNLHTLYQVESWGRGMGEERVGGERVGVRSRVGRGWKLEVRGSKSGSWDGGGVE